MVRTARAGSGRSSRTPAATLRTRARLRTASVRRRSLADFPASILELTKSLSRFADCQYAVGDTFYVPLTISYSERGAYVGYYVCYLVSNIIITILAARFLTFRYSKR